MIARLVGCDVFAQAPRITGKRGLVKTMRGQQVPTQAETLPVEFSGQQRLVRERQFDALIGDFSSHIGEFMSIGARIAVVQLTKSL